MPPATLITIPFSHYCEKARWALDVAGVPYVEQGHVPGFHRVAVRRSGSPGTSVPVLVAGGRVLGDSTEIMTYADEEAPIERRLYPREDSGSRAVLDLEEELDEELGPHLRRVMYFHLLPERPLIFGMMDQHTPLWERAALRAVYPGLRSGMRRFMKIDAAGAEESLGIVRRVFDRIEALLADGRPYLTGDRFTAADLTLAALGGPAVMPPEHFIRFPRPEELPDAAAALVRETQARPVGAFMRHLYKKRRHEAEERARQSDPARPLPP